MPSTTIPKGPLPAPKPNYSYARKPSTPIAAFLWRRRMWIESTFVLSMLEPWEKFLILTIIAATFTLVMTGVFKYLPHHVATMQRRAEYYLWGSEGELHTMIPWSWFGIGESASASALGSYKES